MENKIYALENYMESHGLPRSGIEIERAFQPAKDRITNPVDSQGGHQAILEAERHNLGKDFQVRTKTRDDVTHKLSSMEEQLTKNKEVIENQGEIQKAFINKNLGNKDS